MTTPVHTASRRQLVADAERGIRMNYRGVKKNLRSMFSQYLTRNEFFILRSLCQNSPQIASALSNEFQFSASMITALADELTKKGLISRERSERDRRVVELQATEEGRVLFETLEHMKIEYLMDVFDDFSDEELLLLSKLLDRMDA